MLFRGGFCVFVLLNLHVSSRRREVAFIVFGRKKEAVSRLPDGVRDTTSLKIRGSLNLCICRSDEKRRKSACLPNRKGELQRVTAWLTAPYCARDQFHRVCIMSALNKSDCLSLFISLHCFLSFTAPRLDPLWGLYTKGCDS